MFTNIRTVPPPAQQYLSVSMRGLRGLGGPGLATTALAGGLSAAAGGAGLNGLGLGMDELSPTWRYTIWALGTAGFVASLYHGYKRWNGKFWPTFGWGVFGAFLPIISVPVALAQGFAKRKGG